MQIVSEDDELIHLEVLVFFDSVFDKIIARTTSLSITRCTRRVVHVIKRLIYSDGRRN